MPRVLFLDDGGVISDNAERTLQWQRLLAEFFVPRLGGTPEAWGAANAEVFAGPFSRGGFGGQAAYIAEVGALRDSEWESAQRANSLAWVRGMCELVGVPSPPGDAACLGLAREAVDFVTPRVRASFPEVVDAIRGLYADGYVMHTASGNRSFELDRYLRGLHIRECFAAGPLYGCDVVRMPKVGPEFYVRVFEHTGVRPKDALVVDDSPLAVEWASEVGAEALLVSRSTSAPSDVPSPTMPSDRRSPVATLPSLAAVRKRLAVKDA